MIQEIEKILKHNSYADWNGEVQTKESATELYKLFLTKQIELLTDFQACDSKKKLATTFYEKMNQLQSELKQLE